MTIARGTCAGSVTGAANALRFTASKIKYHHITFYLIVYSDLNRNAEADFEVGLVGLVKLVQADFLS